MQPGAARRLTIRDEERRISRIALAASNTEASPRSDKFARGVAELRRAAPHRTAPSRAGRAGRASRAATPHAAWKRIPPTTDRGGVAYVRSGVYKRQTTRTD